MIATNHSPRQCNEEIVNGEVEAKNGWGTVRDTIRFFTYILNAWGDLVAYSPELAKVATFWVE